MKQKISELLLSRLRRDGYDDSFPEGTKLIRLYPGHHQRSAGAWLWCGYGTVRALCTGSTYTMRECLKTKRITSNVDPCGNMELFPEND